jgi:hypothetical protein
MSINVHKLYSNPWYLFKILQQAGGRYKEIFIASSGKTPETFLLSLVARGYRSGVSDHNGNFFLAACFDRLVLDDIYPDFGSEIKNAKRVYSRLVGAGQNFKYSSVIFAPYASTKLKSMGSEKCISILRVLGEMKVKTVVVTDQDVYGLREIEKDPLIEWVVGCKLEEVEDRIKQFTTKDCLFIGADSSLLHLFHLVSGPDSHTVVFTGLGYPGRFDYPEDYLVYRNCKYSGCQWNCKFSEYRCLDVEVDQMNQVMQIIKNNYLENR